MALARDTLASPRRWLVPGPLILLLLVGSVASISLDTESADAIGFLGMLVGQAAAGVLLIRRSRRLEPLERRAWLYLSATMLLAATGVLVVGVWALVVGDPPAFGPTDSFFIAGYVMLFVALVQLARVDSEGSNWLQTILDALVGGVALTALVWNAFLHDLVVDAMAPGWEAARSWSTPAAHRPAGQTA